MTFAYDSDIEPAEEELCDFSDDFDAYDDLDFEALGINPTQPTDAKPGSEDKVIMLAARYSAGLPLWHSEDRYDHGPGQIEQTADVATGESFLEEDE